MTESTTIISTKENFEKAFKDNHSNIRHIPREFQTHEMCLQAVEGNGMLLEYVFNKTPEICKKAVECNCYALEFVPEELRTKELCEKAVNGNGYALKFVPEELKTKELCKLAVFIDPSTLEHTHQKNFKQKKYV